MRAAVLPAPRAMLETKEGGGPVPMRIGGAAADFAAGLGRKSAELRTALGVLVQDPTHERARDELRRKLHALGVGARLLQFEALAQAIAAGTERLDEVDGDEAVPKSVLIELETLLAQLPDLAWQRPSRHAPASQTPAPRASVEPREAAVEEEAPESIRAPQPASPWTVMVIGSDSLAEVLESDPATFPCDVEPTSDLATALDLARAVAPDLLVVDIDRRGAIELVGALAEDPLTAPVPVIALGESLSRPFEGAPADAPPKLARLMSLGVARAIEKPASAVVLREACADVVGERSRAIPSALPPELGELTVSELARRLEREIDRLLVDPLDPSARDRRVALGAGAEVLGPFWGALARIRDVVRDRSRGSVAFRDDRLRRPIAVGSATQDVEGARTAARRGDLEVDLEGRTLVVADDDAGVCSFVADALREAGAHVEQAEDGEVALRLARRHDAVAVVSDVVMPRMDGVTLSRALRRDVALRDRPVILLSWKEDLLQRLRDLRVESRATLRKDDDARTIVARVREVLAGRVRVEARIASGAEVRGRLDDLTVPSLLSIVDRVRHDACVVVRDAAHVYEVELDGGGIRRIARTGVDGSFARGADVLPGLLGATGGRFLVRPLPSRGEGEALSGELPAQLEIVIRSLRAACDAVTGERTIELAAVALDKAMLGAYLPVTPEPARSVLVRLADGASPREMILAGDVAPSLLEDVLLDAASRGLVTRATGVKGEDLIAQALARVDVDVRPPRARHAEPPAPTTLEPQPLAPVAEVAPSPRPPSEPAPALTPIEFSLDSIAPPAAPEPPRSKPEEAGNDTPGSLADAVLQVSTPGASTSKPPILDARELRPRSSTRSDPPERAPVRASNPDIFSATPTPKAKSDPPKPRNETLQGIAPQVEPTLPPPARNLEALEAPAVEPPRAEPSSPPAERAKAHAVPPSSIESEHDEPEELSEEPPRALATRAAATSADGFGAFVWTLVIFLAVAAAVAWYLQRGP